MNYLAHLSLAPPDRESWLGALLADFLRAGEEQRYPVAVQREVARHRAVDAFTDDHALVRRARGRLGAEYRLVRGVMVDIFFDHFLARHFEPLTGEPLGAFTARVYAGLARVEQELALPARLAWVLPRLRRQDWLGCYAELDNVGLALGGVARRLSRPTRLAQGLAALRANYAELEADFLQFFPELRARHGAQSPRPGTTT